MQTYGKGVVVDESDPDVVVITFRKDGSFGKSGSGKTSIVATTSGNVQLDCGITIGLNAYRK